MTVCTPIILVATLSTIWSTTTLDKAGIRSRNYGVWRKSCSWQDVSAIAARRSGTRGSTNICVRVTLADGRGISLAAPRSGTVMPDPEFGEKYDQIVAYWQGQRALGKRLPIR